MRGSWAGGRRALTSLGSRVVERPRRVRPEPPPIEWREEYEASRPVDPLRGVRAYPPIEIMIPCAVKDLATVGLAVQASRDASLNPVAGVRLVAPDRAVPALQAMFGAQVAVTAEEELALPRTFDTIRSRVAAERRGWVVQQVLKLSGAATCPHAGVLVVDADTILLAPRVWLVGRRQLLPVVHEYHLPYVRHTEQCLGRAGRSDRVTYVAHHQLMQPRVVRRMLTDIRLRQGGTRVAAGADVGLDTALAAWVATADHAEQSALSEYHTYGAFLRNSEPSHAVVARWANAAVSRTELSPTGADSVAALRARFPGALSVSLHAYLG